MIDMLPTRNRLPGRVQDPGYSFSMEVLTTIPVPVEHRIAWLLSVLVRDEPDPFTD